MEKPPETFDHKIFDKLVLEVVMYNHPVTNIHAVVLSYDEAAEICSRYCHALDKQDFEGPEPEGVPI